MEYRVFEVRKIYLAASPEEIDIQSIGTLREHITEAQIE